MLRSSSLLSCRSVYKRQICNASRLSYSEHGDPAKVLRLEHFEPQVGVDKVGVKMELATLNPADLNTIEGKYPIRPSSFPAVAGIEGVGRVLSLPESATTSLQKGDRVLLFLSGQEGTWSSHLSVKPSQCYKVSSELPLECAATLRTNPATAYRMLADFVPNLRAGDAIIQNGGNSAVGQAVIMLAKKKGLISVNVVRDRENVDELKEQLKAIGADHVLTEKEIRKGSVFRDDLVPRPRLALNCVGGESATELCRWLTKKGVHVTYGGMSKKPVTLSTASLIFSDVTAKGFWLSRWYKEARSEEVSDMMDDLTKLCLEGTLKPPRMELVPLEEFQSAVKRSQEGFQSVKFLFDMRHIG